MTPMTLTRHAAVMAILADPSFDVLEAPPGERGVAWLRGAVSRFSRDPAHTGRRAVAVRLLATVAPADLRREAAATGAGPTAVLGAALGARGPVVDAVGAVCPAYFGAESDVDGAEGAVEALVAAFGGVPDDETAARIALLVQGHDATTALVARTLRALDRWRPALPLPAVMAEVLRHDPPVPAMRRQHLGNGAVVVLDLVAANRDADVFPDPDRFDPARPNLDQVLTFGVGPRPCPGRDHAFALALGTVEGVLAARSEQRVAT